MRRTLFPRTWIVAMFVAIYPEPLDRGDPQVLAKTLAATALGAELLEGLGGTRLQVAGGDIRFSVEVRAHEAGQAGALARGDVLRFLREQGYDPRAFLVVDGEARRAR